MDENALIRRYCYYTQNGFITAYPILRQTGTRTLDRDKD